MTFVVDLVIVGIVLLSAIIGSKRGFMRVAIELVGFVAVLLFAVWASNNLAAPIYDNGLKDSIEQSITQSISLDHDIKEDYDKLPSIVTFALSSQGITAETVQEFIDTKASESVSSIAVILSENVIKPIVTALISAILMFIIFFIGMFLIKLIAKWVNSLIKHTPFVGKVNSFLGIFVGLLKGVIISMALIWLFGILVEVFPSGGIFNIDKSTLNSAFLCNLLNSINPLV